jgi:Cdc6-like AAA superfamily ATPase
MTQMILVSFAARYIYNVLWQMWRNAVECAVSIHVVLDDADKLLRLDRAIIVQLLNLTRKVSASNVRIDV